MTDKIVGLGQEVGELFRRATRPIVTIICVCTIADVVTSEIVAPQWFIGMAVTVILSWFTERTVKAVKGTTEAK